MTKAQLLKKIARLESQNDFISTELCQIDQMMRKIGFSNGLETIKSTAHEIIDKKITDKDSI